MKNDLLLLEITIANRKHEVMTNESTDVKHTWSSR